MLDINLSAPTDKVVSDGVGVGVSLGRNKLSSVGLYYISFILSIYYSNIVGNYLSILNVLSSKMETQ